MIDLKYRPQPIADDITVCVHLTGGQVYEQSFTIDEADHVQTLIDWLRKPGRENTITIEHTASRTLHILHHDKIAVVDITGYIEPAGRASRWYERLIDRWRARKYG